MKLYSKQINSVVELQREKARLAAMCKKMENEASDQVTNFKLLGFSTSNKSNSQVRNTAGISSILEGLLPGAGPFLKVLEDILPESSALGDSLRKKSAKLAGNAAKELIGGYLKWKAVELGFRGVRYLFRKRKQGKAGKKPEKAV
jgi:hypothetical protein